MENLIKDTKDLLKQATTEKSHFYVASILQKWLAAAEQVKEDNIMLHTFITENTSLKGKLRCRNVQIADLRQNLEKLNQEKDRLVNTEMFRVTDIAYKNQVIAKKDSEIADLKQQVETLTNKLYSYTHINA